MKKYILPIYALATICIGSATITSCSDPDDVQNLVLDRVLSPTGITARVSQDVNIIVNWNEMKGATSYEIEAYADTPDYDQRTPDVTSTTSLTSDTLTNLIGETDYYIRVRALDADNSSRTSKWMEIVRTTNPEQNMNKVKAGDIQSKAVKVTWTPGLQVDAIICAPTAANSTAETVTYTLTDTDISSGSATVTGLTPETSYRATLKLGEKTRGYATFTTNMDFSDAVQLTPADDWANAIENAAAGSKFALAPGQYTLLTSKLKINSNVIIGAQDSGDLPVINTCINIYNGASLYLYQIVLDGAGSEDSLDKSQAIEYKSAGGFGGLTIDGCEIKNYVKGFIYINVAAVPNSIKINNSIIHDIECNGGDFIDSRKGGWNNLSISSSTIYNCASARDILRADDASGSVSANMVTSIDKCTFYNVGDGGKNYRFFYLRFPSNTNTFTNNVVANFCNTRGFANSNSVGVPTYSNNYYYNCKNLVSQAEGNSQTGLTCFDTEGNILEENPFANPDKADFTITNELLQSYAFGDPRWY